jgi:hypothetical protein
VLETGKDQFGKDLAEQPRLCAVWVHRTVRWCTGQCPVRQAGSGELAALGFRRRRTAIKAGYSKKAKHHGIQVGLWTA